jgi:hypothetical protein
MSAADLRRRLLRLEGARAAVSGVAMVACEAIGPDAVRVGGHVFHRGADESGEQLLQRVSEQQARAAGAAVCLLAGPLDQRL